MTAIAAGSQRALAAGTYEFGPEGSSIWVRTGRGGAAAAAGHDLVIQVTSWQATLEVSEVPAQSSIVLAVDASSLRVRDGVGGLQPLGDADKESIQQIIDEEILREIDIEFRSTTVESSEDGGRISVRGDLTLVGTARPIEFDLVIGDDGALSGNVVLTQTNWGITPYSTLFGALKVTDEVEVVVNASLRPAESGKTVGMPDWSVPWDLEWRPKPIIDPGISSFIWSLVFFGYLWLGMAAVGVSPATALIVAFVAAWFIFLLVRTRGVGRHGTDDPDQSP